MTTKSLQYFLSPSEIVLPAAGFLTLLCDLLWNQLVPVKSLKVFFLLLAYKSFRHIVPDFRSSSLLCLLGSCLLLLGVGSWYSNRGFRGGERQTLAERRRGNFSIEDRNLSRCSRRINKHQVNIKKQKCLIIKATYLWGHLTGLQACPQHLSHCQAHSRFTVNVYWVKKLMS